MHYYHCWHCTVPLYVYAMMYTPSENRLSFSSHVFLYFGRCLSVTCSKQLLPFPKKKKDNSKNCLSLWTKSHARVFTDIISISCNNSISMRLLIFILQIKTKYQGSWFKYLRSEIKSDRNACYMQIRYKARVVNHPGLLGLL